MFNWWSQRKFVEDNSRGESLKQTSNNSEDVFSLCAKSSDTRILELREKHHEMEHKINELRELSKQRDSEMQRIKETIRECKDKVATIKQSFSEDSSTRFAFLGDKYIGKLINDFNLRNADLWKVAGGGVSLLILLRYDCCSFLVPKLPRIYNLLSLVTLFYHFVLLTGLPVLKRYAVHMGLEENVLIPYENSMGPWYHLIGAVLCALSIFFLKLKRCDSGAGCGTFIQMAMASIVFFLEYGIFLFMDKDSRKGRNAVENNQNMNQIVAGLQMINIVASIYLA